MPTNEQRRATAKRKLERQLERRAKQARTRRILVIALGVIAALVVIAAVVTTVVVTRNDHKSTPSALTSGTTASSSPAASTPAESIPPAAPLPPFQPSANVGANCQYPASQDKAAKPVKPPRTGKVPTDPAQVSVSMATSQGNIGLMLANNESPCTVNSFASLIGQGFFNGTKCHRLTTEPTLSVLQCGSTKDGGPGGDAGYEFANEYPTDQYPPNDPKLQEPVVYPRGTLAMANTGQPNSNSSQFFMVYKDSELPPQYTVFGKIQDDGLATLDKIAKAGVAGGGAEGQPATEVTIKSMLLD